MEVVKRLQEMCDDDHLIRNPRKEKIQPIQPSCYVPEKLKERTQI
jgi:hypothetical protein